MKDIYSSIKLFGIFSIIICSLVFTGCSSSHRYKHGKSKVDVQLVIKTAKDMLGVKYRFGGASPKRGFDCSGLVQYSHKIAGVDLPRTTREQFRAAKRVSLKYLKAGDLVFFKTTPSRSVSHVGIYLGNNKFIHAPSSGKRVKISSIKEKYWRKRYAGAGRFNQ